MLHASLVERLRALRGPDRLPPELLDVVLERVPVRGHELALLRPRDWPALREADRAERRPTPYWAVSWASGRALAPAAAEESLAGRTAIELGCVLGLVGVAAARAGARVTALDAAPEAVVFAAHNLALNGLEGQVALGGFEDAHTLLRSEPADLVLAADVLYTHQNVRLLLDLLPRLVAPGGEAWIADPGRTGWDEFRPLAKGRWRIASTLDRERPQAWVHRLSRRRG